MVVKNTKDIARIIKYRRTSAPLKLRELSAITRVSISHLARIERGERFPSARVLQKIAKPLGFGEDELFMLAGYLSIESSIEAKRHESHNYNKRLDPGVARVLGKEPVKVQWAVIAILSILRSFAKGAE